MQALGIGAHKVNTVHNRALRAYLDVHKYCTVAALQGEMGFEPQIIRRKIDMARLWNHIVQLDETSSDNIFHHENAQSTYSNKLKLKTLTSSSLN